MGGKDWQDMQLGCLWQGSDLITVNARGHIIFHSLETPQQPKKVIKVSLAGISCCPTPVFWDNQGQFGLCLVLTTQQPVIVIKVSLVYASCWPHSSLSVSSRSVHILTPWQHVAVAGVIMVGLTCIGWFDFDPIATFHFISGSVRPAPHVDPIAAFSWSLWLAHHIDTITALSWSLWLAHHIDPIAACHCIRVIKVSLTCTSHWPLCNLHQGVIKGSSRSGLKHTLFLVACLTPAMILHHSVTRTCCGLQLAIFLTCVFQGHMKPITAMAVSSDKTTAFTGSQEGISILCKLFSPDFTLLWKQQTQQTMFDGGDGWLGGWWEDCFISEYG